MTLKKMFLFVLAVAILIPAVSNATVSRYLGLGGPGTNYIVYDASNPSIYPQLTTKWVKLFGVEYGTGNGAWDHTLVYAVWDFEGGSAIKFILDSSPSSMFATSGTLFGMTGNLFANTNAPGNFHMLNLQYGRPLGEDLDFGVGLRYEGKGAKAEDPLTIGNYDKVEAAYSSFGLTVGLTAMEKKLDAALFADFAGFSRDEDGKTVAENDGSMRFGIQGRYWYKYNDQSTLVPHLRFVNHKLGVKNPQSSPETTASKTVTDFLLGLGHNWRPVENCLIVFEVGFQAIGTKYEYDNGSTTNEENDAYGGLYWRAGGETKINSWLWGRAGAVRMWTGETDERYDMNNDMTYKDTYGYSTTSIFCGGTAHWKRVHFDFLVEPNFFKYGPAFIGGDSGRGLTTQVSLRYQLDEADWTK